MEPIHVNVYIHAPIETVFDTLTDHEGYSSYPGVGVARLLRPGDTERNGLGAQREIRAMGIRFVEEVTAFERPTRMDYLIRECSLPLRHLGGSMQLARRGDGTEVTWTSHIEPTIPLVGGLLAKIMRPTTIEGFTRFLLAVKDRLERRAVKSADVRAPQTEQPTS